ncbi:caspase family protein [Chamaesiphon sp. GL140_3_metabinner_50]|uniref:caspase family protein n=1 Tax=Chamaesiphon sp. GL140_3_metabinner_50 TaxID=2970812 RepID=UPI0025FF8FBA|nr:caspase family protein [Chamaesiphon sp. GL140_3_metabinner_50]
MANQACISIGINQYQFLPPLSYGTADATAIEEFFVDAAGWNPQQCLLLTDTSAETGNKSTYPTRENINRWLKQLSWETLHHGDLLWFFFSGCGVSFGNEDYLVPIDGKVEDIANTCISIRQLYQQFNDIGVNALVFLDANRSQHLSVGGGIGKATAKFAQDYQVPTFLSCQSHEFSHEDAGLGHGLFTTALLETLNYHPDLNLETIDTYLTTRLAELSEHHWKPLQTPISVIPTGVSEYRPVFSTTTQSSISSAAVPEVVYSPPPKPQFNQDTYAPYQPPTPSILAVTPEQIGTGAIIRKLQPQPRRKGTPNWMKVSTLMVTILAAGLGIYMFNRQPSADTTDRSIVKPVPGEVSGTVPTPIASSIESSPSLQQARLFVKPGDATSRYQAILAARKIPITTPEATKEIQQSIELWSEEIYQISQGYADKQHWQLAIDTARMVPKDAPNYSTAQGSMVEWKNKL